MLLYIGFTYIISYCKHWHILCLLNKKLQLRELNAKYIDSKMHDKCFC